MYLFMCIVNACNFIKRTAFIFIFKNSFFYGTRSVAASAEPFCVNNQRPATSCIYAKTTLKIYVKLEICSSSLQHKYEEKLKYITPYHSEGYMYKYGRALF